MEDLVSNLVGAVTTFGIVIVCVIFHYEGLNLLSRRFNLAWFHHRIRVLALIFGQLILHVTEILIFACGYYFLSLNDRFGSFLQASYLGAEQPMEMGFMEQVYFSSVVYSTLGFGDIIPAGSLRFMTGTEAVLGLVLITWSASFTYLEMQKHWSQN
jgi:hypothetical protein